MKGDNDDTSVDCREALHRVYHFLDGELTPERRDQIARHLDRCSPCVEAFGFETEIRRLVADRCRDQVPDELRIRIAVAIDHEHQERSKTGGIVEGAEH
ncbi:MAG TPA: mycothiol system anti-sigma-R factor [Acidimicrobiales bacterium]|nr:mycothiol system anti-sigma-R factor [Acidimicrobiales bacterium]